MDYVKVVMIYNIKIKKGLPKIGKSIKKNVANYEKFWKLYYKTKTMREFRKNLHLDGSGTISICDYHEPDNYAKLLEDYRNNPDIMNRGSAPARGGLMVASFYRGSEELADEYIKFKNQQFNR